MSRNYFVSGVLAVVVACSGGGGDSTGPGGNNNGGNNGGNSNPTPTANTVVDPFLQKPFNGEFLVVNPMDHDYPVEFEDTNGRSISSWGEQLKFFDSHSGYDFMMPVGTPLLAAAAGTVMTSETSNFFCPVLNKNVSQLGIQIKHTFPNGLEYWTYYAHLSRLDVAAGAVVTAGQQIGLSGNSGCTTAPHLHFQLDRVNGTNNGSRATVDPYGWSGAGTDPWKANAKGALSINLWKAGQAPEMFLGIDSITAPINGPQSGPSKKPVVISAWRWAGPHDESNPNNEYVEVSIDRATYAGSSYDMTGMYIKNNNGDRFNFPSGLTITAGQKIRVYTGTGTNSASTYYWGKSAGVFNNSGDCAELFYPNGGYYLTGLVACK